MFIIVSTASPSQETYWQERLLHLKDYITSKDDTIIVIHEDWPGGAGNALGTLYAYKKGRDKAKELYGIDLLAEQLQGQSIAIYHTAGVGSRLYPITASECNNKSAIKLPQLIGPANAKVSLTVLEAVIMQTANHFCLPGRLSVFWGDQVFVPSENFNNTLKAPIDILSILGDLPSQAEWNKRHLDHYGAILTDAKEQLRYFGKIDFETFQRNRQKKVFLANKMGVSLGCFSFSAAMTEAFLQEFDHELTQKSAKMDSDPCWMMPLTLDEETYFEIMKGQNVPDNWIKEHYLRMQRFKEKFLTQHRLDSLVSTSNIGTASYWWDYGTLANYYGNTMKLTQSSPRRCGHAKLL